MARALVVADLVGLVLAMLVVEVFYGGTSNGSKLGADVELFVFVATLPAWIIAAKLFTLYDRDDERADHSTVDDLVGVFLLVTVGAWLLFAGLTVTRAANPGLTKLVTFWLLAIVFITAARAAARVAVRRSDRFQQNTIVVGAGDVGQLIARKLMFHREYGINLVGFVDDDPRELWDGLDGVEVLGGTADLQALVAEKQVERVVFAFGRDPHPTQLRSVTELRSAGIQVDIVPRLFEALGPHVKLHYVEGLPLVTLPTAKRFPLSRTIKRLVDIVGACIGILMMLPLLPYAAWRIKRESPGPVFFRQTRLGLGGEPFTVYKFRTMRADTDPAVHREHVERSMDMKATPYENGMFKLDQSAAITPFGGWLRKTSLDELPQFFNVLKGDMALVGPRPCMDYETAQFLPHHYERFQVRPGITGLWQVTARAHSTFREALDMDVAYARGWSLALDAWLICRTPVHMLRRDGTV